MNPDDRARWRAATTLAELGRLTAEWLTGEMPSQPAYMPNVGPDPETKELIPTLVDLNLAGFVTIDSQPGMPLHRGYDDAAWEQRAVVSGYADDATFAWLRAAVIGTRFQVLAVTFTHHAYPMDRLAYGVPVTYRDDEPCTRTGMQFTRSELSEVAAGDLSGKAIRAITKSLSVTVYDPEFGPNDMWPVLRRAARRVTRSR